ncbi:molecular chaperone [Vibrio sinensis]|uniref:Molecular chaperone n=1 Tax=Vibrio sinensis TaxID=2302434 RepID=A0A3A6QL68_9VIBR|nr:molecular chaperone TorD family protein [Vibrio sinensis]RJX71938.1 molecular chaperone [Vibrio sinensis]
MQNDSTAFRLLGALLYHAPTSHNVIQLLNRLSQQNDELLIQLAQLGLETESSQLENDFFQLLQGNGDMPCPPWGSAYLDHENALFGSSTIEYRAFLTELGIACDTGMREPEDHIGLMLMMLAVLLEKQDRINANLLVSRHLMPFATFMLEIMEKRADTDFYKALSILTLGWLNLYCEEAGIYAEARRCYWKVD